MAQTKEKKKTKKEIIRGVPDGGTLTIPLEGESYRAWTVRAFELNEEDGWTHYSILRNSRMNTLTIAANTP